MSRLRVLLLALAVGFQQGSSSSFFGRKRVPKQRYPCYTPVEQRPLEGTPKKATNIFGNPKKPWSSEVEAPPPGRKGFLGFWQFLGVGKPMRRVLEPQAPGPKRQAPQPTRKCTHSHTHTKIYIYIYIGAYLYVCI